MVDVEFEKLMKIVYEYEINISNGVNQYNEIHKSMHKFVRENKKMKNIDEFISKHSGELLRLHDILVGSFAKIYANTVNLKNLRSLHDSFFGILSIHSPGKKFQNVPTQLFTAFIQGITYFENEKERAFPVYHRSISCGSKSKTVEEKFRNYDKSNLILCLIERLIYDNIYTNTFHRQDLGHLFELKKVEREYQDSFPGNQIKIDIEYEKHIYIRLN